MFQPILITGASGGSQGSTGRLVTGFLLKQGVPVRAFVHKLDARSDELRQQGAEIVVGDLLNPASVHTAMRNVKRAFFTYPVADGLLEATTIFATAGHDAGLELVVNNSQFQSTPDNPAFRDLQALPLSGICSIGWPIVSSTVRRLEPFIFRRRPIMKMCALSSAVVSPSKMQPSCHGAMKRPSSRSPVRRT